MVSQETNVTGDSKPSENRLYDCVAASIDAACRYLLNKPEDSVFNPDTFKDQAYGDRYIGGTAATKYVEFCKSLGVLLFPVQRTPDQLVVQAHAYLAQNKPVIFTEPDPYSSDPGMTHVCCFYADGTGYLIAMDPFPLPSANSGHPVRRTDAEWIRLLQFNEIWIAERLNMNTIPNGWKDDGHTLTAPNGFRVMHGFRDYVLSHNWDTANWPLENEVQLAHIEDSNPSLGEGAQQIFRWITLEYTKVRGVFEMWTGQELIFIRDKAKQYWERLQQMQPGQPADTSAQEILLQAALDAANSKVADLQKQLDAEKAKEQQVKAAVEADIAGL